MRWDNTHSANQFHYWKMEQDEFTAELKYNQQAHSFRLTAGDKRLFFIEKTGFLQNKYLLKTEYSVVTGEAYPIKNWHSGMVAIDNKKFNYFLKGEVLSFSSKKENFTAAIKVSEADKIHQWEFFALLFSTLKVLMNSFVIKSKPALV